MMNDTYCVAQMARAEIDALTGPALLEFGTGWCGHCRATQAPLAAAFAQHPGVPHLRMEDGPGRALGRSFRVKLWPTLIFPERWPGSGAPRAPARQRGDRQGVCPDCAA